jgi:hypothetical protein
MPSVPTHGNTVPRINFEINFSMLWKTKVQPRCKFFMWLWIREHLIDDLLQQKYLDHGDRCCLFYQENDRELI